MQEENIIYRKADCPWGNRALKLLKEHGVSFEDHVFDSKVEEENFKNEQHVKTTPQIFLNGERLGGYTDLAKRFGDEQDKEKTKKGETTYIPVVAVFSVSFFINLATFQTMVAFMGYSLCILATLKLMDIESFAESFKKYDFVTKRFENYGYAYPFIELAVGLGFLSGLYPIMTSALAVIVGVLGCYSIYKAVYVEHIDVNCACVGGGSNVPLGAVSFTENLIMMLMGGYLFYLFL